jgi:hypothetical protein
MSNINLPSHWSAWAIIGAVIFLILLATEHAATAFAGLCFIGVIFIIVLLAGSSFSSGVLWIVLGILVALLLILGLVYVPAEWRPQPTATIPAPVLAILSLIV